jgi:hypothetical protein
VQVAVPVIAKLWPLARENLVVDIQVLLYYCRAVFGETQNQFSLTGAALSTFDRAKRKFLSVQWPKS